MSGHATVLAWATGLLMLLAVAGATAQEAPAQEPSRIARLHLEPTEGGLLVWAENLLAGPIEVMLHGDGHSPAAHPALPARATVPAYGRVLVSRIGAAGAAGMRFSLEAVPGHPSTRPRDVEYAWPLAGVPLQITQGWGGGFSHAGATNRHAVDFATPVGIPVLTARDGTVMQVESGFSTATLDPHLDGRANQVRILHEDGTMALYAHLDANGVFVRPGQRVRRGQRLGLSGNTGFSAGPHLHFVVQVNRGMRLESIPFRMFGPGGVLRFHEPTH